MITLNVSTNQKKCFMKKNYFKFLLALLMVCCVSVSFSACSSDDDDDNNNTTTGNVIGVWSQTSMLINGSEEGGDETLTIKEDGTYIQHYISDNDYSVGYWKFVNGKLELNFDNELTEQQYPNNSILTLPMTYTVTKLNSSTLVLSGKLLGYEALITYTRK